MSEWISVEDRLPGKEVVLFYSERGGIDLGVYIPDKDELHEWVSESARYGSHIITHWMPLPKYPKAKE